MVWVVPDSSLLVSAGTHSQAIDPAHSVCVEWTSHHQHLQQHQHCHSDNRHVNGDSHILETPSFMFTTTTIMIMIINSIIIIIIMINCRTLQVWPWHRGNIIFI